MSLLGGMAATGACSVSCDTATREKRGIHALPRRILLADPEVDASNNARATATSRAPGEAATTFKGMQKAESKDTLAVHATRAYAGAYHTMIMQRTQFHQHPVPASLKPAPSKVAEKKVRRKATTPSGPLKYHVRRSRSKLAQMYAWAGS